MKTLLICILPIVIILLSFYIIRIAGLHKALKSISESDYWLEKPWKWTFEALMLFIGGSLIFVGIYLRIENPLYLLITSGASICGVGLFSRFKRNKIINTLHISFAVVGFSALVLSFWIDFGAWFLFLAQFIVLLGAYLFSISKPNERNVLIWNVEVFLIYSCFMALFPLIVLELI